MTKQPKPLITDHDGVTRCWWCVGDPLYQHYHDTEWGFPVADDTRLFEKLCLEGFQAGLSWLTILRKRENFRAAFAEFDIRRVARFNRRSVDRLLHDAGIVRHRGKIEATINNAKRAIELIDEFGSLGHAPISCTSRWNSVRPIAQHRAAPRDAVSPTGNHIECRSLSRTGSRQEGSHHPAGAGASERAHPGASSL